MTQQCPDCNAFNDSGASFCANCGVQLGIPVSQYLNTNEVLLNRYRIDSLLGQGGFGAVYRAWDTALNRSCAVKENLETGTQAQQQFQQEASILANLSHPNLPRVTDHFVLPGQGQYLVMDFVDGHDLDSILSQGGPLPAKQAVKLISQIAEALTYLHSQPRPVIHRDIKPANIRVRPDGHPFLVDFGLVKLFATHRMTTAAARGITPGYSPPEQYGQGGTDARSDIYTLGATLYTLVTGLIPQESVGRAARDTLVHTHLVNPGVPQSVSAVIARAMALNPAQRYRSAAEFKIALEAAITSPASRGTIVIPPSQQVMAPVESASVPISRPVLSGMAIGAVIMGLILIVLVAVVGFVVIPKWLETPTPQAAVIVVTATSASDIEPPTATQIDESISIPPTVDTEEEEPLPPTITPTPIPTSTDSPEPMDVAMDPNQGWIALSSSRSGDTEIAVMKADGSGFWHLTSHESYCDEPDFSPDGTRIAFERKFGQDYNWEIHIIGVDGSGEYSLGDGRLPAWSPDGSWIAFEDLDNNGNEQIWRMTSDGRNREQLTFDNYPNRSPNWSPDGRKLVMMSKVGGNWQIVIFDLSTRQGTQITSGNTDKRFPVWSPDGMWITYNTLKGGSPDQIWIINPDGKNEHKLTNSGQNGRPSWSPDGHYVIFNAKIGDEWKIVRISVDGSDYQIISRGGGGDGQPDWIP
jgi:serine/threonine protein kinase